ncbi:hypothetical protein Tco_0544873, partial [Tanacetum coccineum]
LKPVDKEDQVFLEELERLKRQEQDANDAGEALRKEFAQEIEDLLLKAGAAKASSTNIVNTTSIPVSTASAYGGLSFTDLTNTDQDDSEIPALEEIYDNPTDALAVRLGRALATAAVIMASKLGTSSSEFLRETKFGLVLKLKGSKQSHIKVHFKGIIAKVQCQRFKYQRSPVLWAEIGESSLIGPELVQEMTDKVVLIKEKLKAARDRQKSYADNRHKLLELRVGPVAYRLRLPEELIDVHDTFHVSNLKKCLRNANLHVPLNESNRQTFHFVEEPVEIMDRNERDRLIVLDRDMFVMFERERLNGG